MSYDFIRYITQITKSKKNSIFLYTWHNTDHKIAGIVRDRPENPWWVTPAHLIHWIFMLIIDFNQSIRPFPSRRTTGHTRHPKQPHRAIIIGRHNKLIMRMIVYSLEQQTMMISNNLDWNIILAYIPELHIIMMPS